MAKKYIVDLNEAEKEEFIKLTRKGRPGASKIKRANILLMANAVKTDFEIVERFALPACGRAWILLGSRKNPKPEKCS
jgi:hypothetical protein